ncbi:DUF502 domain-containing protein, partial [Gemmatimonadota bacterium]
DKTMSKGNGRITTGVRRSFAAGLLVLLPLLLTIWILEQLFNLVSSVLFGPVSMIFGGAGRLEDPLPLIGWSGLRVEHLVPVLSILALLLIIFMLGLIARNVLGARALAFGNRIMTRIPIIRRVYVAVSQISEAFLSSQKGAFKRAVLFQYPRPGMWSVGFVTNENAGNILVNLPADDYYFIFLPTTPNPTSGFMLIVPQKDCIDLAMPVEDALKLIISGGAVNPVSPPSGVPVEIIE